MNNKTKLEKAFRKFKREFSDLEDRIKKDPGLLWDKIDQDHLENIEDSVEKIVRVVQESFGPHQKAFDKRLLKELTDFLKVVKDPQADKLWIQRLHDLAEVWTKKCLILIKGLGTEGIQEFIDKVEDKNKEQLIESSIKEFKQQDIKGEPKEKLMVFSRIYGKKLLIAAVEEIKHKAKRALFKGPITKLPKPLCEEIIATKDNTKATHLLLAASSPGARDFTDFVFLNVKEMWMKEDSYQRLIPPYNMKAIEEMIENYLNQYRNKAPESVPAMAQVLGYLLIEAELSISSGIERVEMVRSSLGTTFNPPDITPDLHDKAIKLLKKIEEELTKISQQQRI